MYLDFREELLARRNASTYLYKISDENIAPILRQVNPENDSQIVVTTEPGKDFIKSFVGAMFSNCFQVLELNVPVRILFLSMKRNVLFVLI